MGGDSLVDMRDQAILLTAFAFGGWRRSEIANLRVEDLVDEETVREDSKDETSPLLPYPTIRLGRTKTTTVDDDEHVVLIGRPVEALKRWLAEHGSKAARSSGACKKAGHDEVKFSAHRLRSGYLTEAASCCVPLLEAMQQSLHKSVRQAGSYYRNTEGKNGPAARLII